MYLPPKTFFDRSVAEHKGARVGLERAAERGRGSGTQRSHDLPCCCKDMRHIHWFVQKRVSTSASEADGVGPGTVLCRLIILMKNESMGSVTQRG